MRMVIDIPDNMKDICLWHKYGISVLTNIEVDILASAVGDGIVIPKADKEEKKNDN